MSIINATPDSFSDGGDAFAASDAVSLGLQHVASGAEILDVGGMSTRPGADDVSVEEELRRVVPVIRGLRERGVRTHISVDTFRAEVARRAVEAGATMVNDVTGGVGDEEMLDTVAELAVPYVVMHSRGDPKSMGGLVEYEGGEVVAGVRKELEVMVERALAKGVKRWNIIVDPGVGFAKDARGNVDLLRGLGGIRKGGLEGYPLLVGASRKRFLGALVGDKQAKQRDVATAATTVAAVQAGAAIVRVHDVAMTRDVVAVADALYRQ